MAEFAWPGVFGRPFARPVSWVGVIPPQSNHRIWAPLYVGGLTLVFGLGAWGFRDGTPWRAWLSGIAVVSLIAGFGEFASPIFVARFVPAVAKVIGEHDPYNTNSIRLDGMLRDGDGSPYSILAATLPGFHTFRYPAKLLGFTALALSALAGIGWEAAAAGRARGTMRIAVAGLGVSVLTLTMVTIGRAVACRRARPPGGRHLFRPARRGGGDLGHSGRVAPGVYPLWGGLVAGPPGPDPADPRRVAGAGRHGDDRPGRGERALDYHCRSGRVRKKARGSPPDRRGRTGRPGPGSVSHPSDAGLETNQSWKSSSARPIGLSDLVRWERDTIQPKYGLLHDVEYTYTMGTAELYDYEWFFAPFMRTVDKEPPPASWVSRAPERIVIYPRRGFDLWNTRYFVLPYVPDVGPTPIGGSPSFLAPRPRGFTLRPTPSKGPDRDAKMRQWAEHRGLPDLSATRKPIPAPGWSMRPA